MFGSVSDNGSVIVVAWLRKKGHFDCMSQSGARVALLIDGDNSPTPSIPSLLTKIEAFGEVTIRRIYGNWSRSSTQRWQELARQYGFEQRHHGQTVPGKNATDIALTIDAMDILYSGTIDHFCLLTSDSDYTPLALRLRSAGCKVLGVGKQTTPLALKAACTEFIVIDLLLAQPVQASALAATSASTLPATVTEPTATIHMLPAREDEAAKATGLPRDPIPMLVKAYEDVVQREEGGWIRLSYMGTMLKQAYTQFRPGVYGQKDLQALLKAYPEQFEMRRQASKGKPILVRWKNSTTSQETTLAPSQKNGATTPQSRKRKQTVAQREQKATSASKKAEPSQDTVIISLLIQAYKCAVEQRSEDWVPIPQLSTELQRLDPQFKTQTYGYKNLPMLVKNHAHVFLIRKQTAGKTKHLEVQLIQEQ